MSDYNVEDLEAAIAAFVANSHYQYGDEAEHMTPSPIDLRVLPVDQNIELVDPEFMLQTSNNVLGSSTPKWLNYLAQQLIDVHQESLGMKRLTGETYHPSYYMNRVITGSSLDDLKQLEEIAKNHPHPYRKRVQILTPDGQVEHRMVNFTKPQPKATNTTVGRSMTDWSKKQITWTHGDLRCPDVWIDLNIPGEEPSVDNAQISKDALELEFGPNKKIKITNNGSNSVGLSNGVTLAGSNDKNAHESESDANLDASLSSFIKVTQDYFLVTTGDPKQPLRLISLQKSREVVETYVALSLQAAKTKNPSMRQRVAQKLTGPPKAVPAGALSKAKTDYQLFKGPAKRFPEAKKPLAKSR